MSEQATNYDFCRGFVPKATSLSFEMTEFEEQREHRFYKFGLFTVEGKRIGRCCGCGNVLSHDHYTGFFIDAIYGSEL